MPRKNLTPLAAILLAASLGGCSHPKESICWNDAVKKQIAWDAGKLFDRKLGQALDIPGLSNELLRVTGNTGKIDTNTNVDNFYEVASAGNSPQTSCGFSFNYNIGLKQGKTLQSPTIKLQFSVYNGEHGNEFELGPQTETDMAQLILTTLNSVNQAPEAH